MRKIPLALWLALCPTLAQAQEKTPAAAFSFIQSNMGDGSWTGESEHCDKNFDNCSAEYGFKITSVSYYNNNYCFISMTMATEYTPYQVIRRIDLTKSIQITASYSALYFDGPITNSRGNTYRGWTAAPPSYAINERVRKAFEYLQSVCKPASAF